MDATAEIKTYVPGFFDKYINYSEKSYKLTRKQFLVGFLTVYIVSKLPVTATVLTVEESNEFLKFMISMMELAQYIFTCYIYVLLVVKRLYDANVSQAFAIVVVIPLFNFIIFGICFFKSSKNNNKDFDIAAKTHIFIITFIAIAVGFASVAFLI